MKNPLPWHRLWLELSPADLHVARRQLEEEGRELGECTASLDELLGGDWQDAEWQARAAAWLDRTSELPAREGFEHVEPDDWESIVREQGSEVELPQWNGNRAELEARVLAAWLGRASGCLLGKPVEGWHRAKLLEFLAASGQAPLNHYLRRRHLPDEVQARFELKPGAGFIDDVTGMPEDDDLNYTVLALELLEQRGRGFTSEDVARLWMERLPVLHTCTAERVAYRNLCHGLWPPRSALHRNPYREWIGAQIRADLFGYVCPGLPALAAELAWRDARVSHVKNGLYGAMWVAAMVASAFVTHDMARIVRAGLDQVPRRSRLAAGVREVLEWREAGRTHDDVIAELHRQHDETDAHDWCHVIPNARIVAAALLWGEDEWTATLCRAVLPCFDTDCNGATAGSVLGVARGPDGIDPRWTEPLRDTLHTGLTGLSTVRFTDLARRTTALAVSS